MHETSVIHNTFVIERTYPSPPERVFSAFANPAQKRLWFAGGEGHEVEEFEMDFRVKGAERLRYRFKESGPFHGVVLASEGIYEDIVPNQRVVTTSTMTLGDNRISTSLVTVELLPADAGTDLICTHQGAFYPGADGPQIRETGWRTLFDRLGIELTHS